MGNSLFTFNFELINMLRTKNKYLRLLLNGLFFIILVLIADLMLGSLLRHYYFKSKYGQNYHLTYSLDSTDASVIILGSGRTNAHYVSSIIENKLNLTCFNTGLDGNYFLNNYAVFRSIIKRYTPKIILIDLRSLNEFFVGSGGYKQLSSLLPYYKEKEEIRNVVVLRSKFERLKLISNIYPFNSNLLSVIQGILKEEDLNELKGYQPSFGILSDPNIPHRQEEIKDIDSVKIRILEALASECKAQNIRLIFIQSPLYTLVEQKQGVLLMKEIAVKYNAEFWNYVNDTMFLKPEYFKDREHMNNLGATEFSEVIADRLKSIIQH